MKISFVGNQDNNAYRYASALRDAGHEVRLHLFRQDGSPRSSPEFVDPSLTGGYPDWIERYDDKLGRLAFLLPSAAARKIERESDVVITSGATGLMGVGHFDKVPIVHLTLGSEVSDFPMRLGRLSAAPHWWAAALMLRRSLRRVDAIVTHGFWPEMRAINRLGLLSKTRLWGFPEDFRGNRDRVNRAVLDELNQQYSACSRVFIWLGRVNYLRPSAVEYKAPEVFLEAFAGVAQRDSSARAVVGDYGRDIAEFHRLVESKGLADRIDFVPHMDFWKVLTYFGIRNAVVVDTPDMERGHIIGGLVREALSVGAPVISAFDESLMSLCYGPGCPVHRATDVQSCLDAMLWAIKADESQFAALKARSAQWASDHLQYERRIGELVKVLREVAYCGGFRRGGRPGGGV